MSLKIDIIVCDRRSVSQTIQFIFSQNINMFRLLELEIALAIPASNDENLKKFGVKSFYKM